MSREPQDYEDLERTESEDEFSPEPVEEDVVLEDFQTDGSTVEEDSSEAVEEGALETESEDSLQPADEDSAEGAEEVKPGKGKKRERKKKKDRGESGGFVKALQRAFPDVYSVMLVVAFLAIVIAIVVLVVELLRYDFDIKGPSAMGKVPAVTDRATLA